QCIFVANHSGCGARLTEEIVERPSVEPLQAIRRLMLERPQHPDLFLNRGATGVLVAPARCRGNVEWQQNRKCQRHAGECWGDSAPWPISRTSTPDGNHDARSQGRLMRCLNPSEISRVGDARR